VAYPIFAIIAMVAVAAVVYMVEDYIVKYFQQNWVPSQQGYDMSVLGFVATFWRFLLFFVLIGLVVYGYTSAQKREPR